MEVYNLTARIRVTDPQRRALARKEMAQLQRLTRQEAKCLMFSIFEDQKREGEFLLWESWEGKAGLDAHFAQAHTQRYLALNLTEVVEFTELNALEA
ncbi:antibiotic biosynthesis monooxygenase [Marinobacterium sp. D7]|uniref:putative quinol monooxygenase n=1 Tax=Marinobacterium ramblicola TaxID=2849041 RepID=UPI001C2CECE5|nr:antibiotic biosynthesis monooxygenase [Marinobacterium ramblicola]MBV1789040.1 antibiotic biosynthesis monooxygenase [Marinobacterium ramblicola]